MEASKRDEMTTPRIKKARIQADSSRGSNENGNPDINGSPDVGAADIALERSLRASGFGNAAAADPSSAKTVPVIDMSLPDNQIADAMWAAANDVGFFTVINHGICEDAVESAFAASKDFFALPKAEKEAASPFARHLNSGYEFMSQVRPSTGTPDQKESLQVTARKGCMDGRWPSSPTNFRGACDALTDEAHALGQRILHLLEPRACPHLTPGTLAGSHKLWGDDGQCTLRIIHYPPMDVETLKALTGGDDLYMRAGAHTDWDAVTLLFQRMGQAGLECCANPRSGSEKEWIPVPPTPGGIAVNIGDMLTRWSDGRLYSNLHRVRMPTPAECTPPSSRYSIAFFMQADKAALISSEKSEPITAGDYILSRIRANYSAPAPVPACPPAHEPSRL